MEPNKSAFLEPLFWDIDFEAFNPQEYPRYTIERILAHGQEEAIQWMFKHFNPNLIKEALTSTRNLSRRSANFWALILDVDKEKVTCLNKSFLETRKQFWPY